MHDTKRDPVDKKQYLDKTSDMEPYSRSAVRGKGWHVRLRAIERSLFSKVPYETCKSILLVLNVPDGIVTITYAHT